MKIDVRILEYDEASSKFKVKNDQVETWRGRLFLKLRSDKTEILEKERAKVGRYLLEG